MNRLDIWLGLRRQYARNRGAQLHRLFQYAAEQGLQLLLDCAGSVALFLPAPVSAAIITQAELEISHVLTS